MQKFLIFVIGKLFTMVKVVLYFNEVLLRELSELKAIS